MSREEAAARIKDHIEIHRYHERNAVKIFEAFDMAIKALEQPEIIRCKECNKQRTCRFSQYQGDDGFCRYAERRTDE